MPYGLQEYRRLVLHHLVDRGAPAYAKRRMHLPDGVGIQQLPPAICIGELRRTSRNTRFQAARYGLTWAGLCTG